jgi:hypothetical protein
MKPVNVPMSEYLEALQSSSGYCPDCRDFNADCMAEPDAENYHCPECDGNRVCGAEQALILNWIEVNE